MKKIIKENTIVVTSAVFTIVAILHLMRLITGSELLIGGYSTSLWLSVGAFILTVLLAMLNLNLIQNKTQIFWLKYILTLIIFDALFALYFWINNLSCLGISSISFSFIFIFDVVLILVLFYYIIKMKKLIKK
ncbi:hypothetical protein K9M50_01875 [Patescibacteria group bacterium]|nr:hypothetical protein [Patescibacteria group bacterium]